MKLLLLFLIVALAAYLFIFRTGPLDRLTKAPAAAESNDRGGISVVRSTGGPSFTLANQAEPGLITIVEFYTDSCHGCQLLKGQLNDFLRWRPDVAVRMIRLPENWQPADASRAYGIDIRATPYIALFDAEGKLVASDAGMDMKGFNLLYQWMHAEQGRDCHKHYSYLQCVML